jgi:hypothetical protein
MTEGTVNPFPPTRSAAIDVRPVERRTTAKWIFGDVVVATALCVSNQ